MVLQGASKSLLQRKIEYPSENSEVVQLCMLIEVVSIKHNGSKLGVHGSTVSQHWWVPLKLTEQNMAFRREFEVLCSPAIGRKKTSENC